jgi:hypothetical protein
MDKSRPERAMAKQALLAGAVVAVGALAVGFPIGGPDAAGSALLGVIAVAGTFALYVAALGRARLISPGAVQAVAMFGWLVRLGAIVAALYGLRAAFGWFSPRSFGLAAIVAALAVAVFETRAWVAEVRPPKVAGGAPVAAGRAPPSTGSGA